MTGTIFMWKLRNCWDSVQYFCKKVQESGIQKKKHQLGNQKKANSHEFRKKALVRNSEKMPLVRNSEKANSQEFRKKPLIRNSEKKVNSHEFKKAISHEFRKSASRCPTQTGPRKLCKIICNETSIACMCSILHTVGMQGQADLHC